MNIIRKSQVYSSIHPYTYIAFSNALKLIALSTTKVGLPKVAWKRLLLEVRPPFVHYIFVVFSRISNVTF